MQWSKKYRTPISVVLSFFLAVCIFVIMFCSEVMMGYLGKRTFYDSVTQSKYIESAINKMQTDVAGLLEARAVSTEDLDKIIDTNLCYIEMKNYMENALEGKKASIDATEFQLAMKDYLEAYLANNQIYQTEGIRSTVDEIVNQAGKIYVRCLQTEFAISFYQFGSQMRSMMTIAIVIVMILGIGIVIILYFLYHHKHKTLRYITMATTSAVIWNIICGAFLSRADVAGTLEVGPEFYLDFIKAYVKNGLDEWWIMSVIAILLLMALFAMVKQMRNSAKKHMRRKGNK